MVDEQDRYARWGNPKARYYVHYWRGVDGDWNERILPFPAGGRPSLLMDNFDNAYLLFGSSPVYAGEVDGVPMSRNDLVVAKASSESSWSNWQLVHKVPGPFINEMLPDYGLWETESILSVAVQETPTSPGDASNLRVINLDMSRAGRPAP